MLEAVLTHLKNWFVVPRGVHGGIFEIKNGSLELPFLQDGQYYRICGSVFNDGLHKYGDFTDILQEETFTGSVWALAIPKAVIDLSEKIEEWQTKNGETVTSPFTSESFGGYSYTKKSGSSSNGDINTSSTWQGAFASKLNQWRKI